MIDEEIRIGQRVRIPADDFAGRIEYGDGGWFVRAESGELGGPWDAAEMTREESA